jgi:hypothetical protein
MRQHTVELRDLRAWGCWEEEEVEAEVVVREGER